MEISVDASECPGVYNGLAGVNKHPGIVGMNENVSSDACLDIRVRRSHFGVHFNKIPRLHFTCLFRPFYL